MDFNSMFNLNKIQPVGRTYIKDNEIYMNFSGSGIIFKTNSDVVSISLKATKFDDEVSRPYISVLIDDQRFDYGLKEEVTNLEFKLDNCEHIIKVLKRTESSVSFVKIIDVNVNDLIEMEEHNGLKIEFYGDSITCGYGTLGLDANEPFKTSTESFLEGYAYYTSKALNARYSAICVSGFPIYKSRYNEGFPIDSIADMISICDYSEDMTFDSAVIWDNNKFIPDIVVVNLGTNDCSYFTEGIKWVDDLVLKYGSFDNVLVCNEFKDALKCLENKIIDFLNVLFSKYENVKVIWALGLLEINPHIQEVFDRVLQNYDNENLFQFNFHTIERVNVRGSNWHPSKLMQEDGANELCQFIKEKVLGDYNG